MKNRVLLYISVAASLIGLAVIYVASQNVQLIVTPAGKITFDDVGKNVKVCGEITSLAVSKKKHTFLKVSDHSGDIEVVIFNSSSEKFGAAELEKGDEICVAGKVEEYEGKLEIIPKEVS